MNEKARFTPAALVSALAVIGIVVFFLEGVPLLFPFSTWAKMILFYHEVQYDPITQSLRFFLPSNVHTFFPMSYVFSRIVYLEVPSPLVVEFVMPTTIQFLLLGILAVILFKKVSPILSSLSIYAVGIMLLYVLGTNPQLWFKSIGFWELLVALILLAKMPEGPRGRSSIPYVLLLITMLLGDDGLYLLVISAFMISRLFLSERPKTRYIWWLGFAGLIYLAYELSISFIAASYYGSYIPALQAQLSEFLTSSSGNLNAAIGRYTTSLPFGFLLNDLSFGLLYVLIPIFIVARIRHRGFGVRKLILPGLVLVVGLSIRVSYSLSVLSVATDSYFFQLFEVLFAVTLFATTLTYSVDGFGTMGGTRGVWGNLSTVVIVFACVLVITLTGLTLVSGPINNATDPRVAYSYLPSAGVFIQGYSIVPVNAHQVIGGKDLAAIFANVVPYKAPLLLSTVLPSEFSGAAANLKQYVYYDNGIIFLGSASKIG